MKNGREEEVRSEGKQWREKKMEWLGGWAS